MLYECLLVFLSFYIFFQRITFINSNISWRESHTFYYPLQPPDPPHYVITSKVNIFVTIYTEIQTPVSRMYITTPPFAPDVLSFHCEWLIVWVKCSASYSICHHQLAAFKCSLSVTGSEGNPVFCYPLPLHDTSLLDVVIIRFIFAVGVYINHHFLLAFPH